MVAMWPYLSLRFQVKKPLLFANILKSIAIANVSWNFYLPYLNTKICLILWVAFHCLRKYLNPLYHMHFLVYCRFLHVFHLLLINAAHKTSWPCIKWRKSGSLKNSNGYFLQKFKIVKVYSIKVLIPITYFLIQRCKNYCQLLCPADIYKMHGILEINFSRYMDFGKSKILNICGIEFCTQSIVYYLFNCHLQIIWCDGCILKIVRSCNLLFKNLGFYTLNKVLSFRWKDDCII